MSFLSSSQLKEFQKNGMLVIEDFVNQNEVRAMRDEISRLVEEMNPMEHRGVFSTTSRSQVCKSKNYRCLISITQFPFIISNFFFNFRTKMIIS